ncbi:MAG: NifB/NifX family molybdenum-iron cluster-binding protein [Candidatus Thiodiazotropha sp.]
MNPQIEHSRRARLAVASKEGLAISEHFGHAKVFWIYEVDESQCRLLEKREVEHYCLGNSSSQSAMTKILQTISDCRAVFIARIGDGPTEKLSAIGVEAVVDYAYEAIEPSLTDYVRRSQKI